MVGLLVKDIYHSLRMYAFVGLMFLIAIVWVITEKNYFFAQGYITFMSLAMVFGTIAWDSNKNGMGYLLTLPISRKQYVLSKYLFCLVTLVVFGALALAVCLIMGAVLKIEVDGNLFLSELSTIMTAIPVMAVGIPVCIIFGNEKKGFARFIILAVAVFIAGAVSTSMMVGDSESGLMGIVVFIGNLPLIWVFVGGALIDVLFIVSTMAISVWALKRKDY